MKKLYVLTRETNLNLKKGALLVSEKREYLEKIVDDFEGYSSQSEHDELFIRDVFFIDSEAEAEEMWDIVKRMRY